jgi:formylglycine-generating enzyme required for sulfatase activity
MSALVRGTPDAYFGLDGASWDEWGAWHRAMLDERASVLERSGFDPAAYDDPETAWSDSCFRQVLLFMYDASFYDRAEQRYRTAELVEQWTALFGRVDSVLLWHAYPRLGFDSRTQFDFYRDMPGTIARLRSEVSDVLHARGIRVFVDYNPWDAGSYEELADVVAGLDADGVMLDTMTDVPARLEAAVRSRRRGVVFAPELRPRDADLGKLRQSWAQWFDVGDSTTPSIYRHGWLVPRHRQMAIRRWDTSRKRDIVYSFFNGSGLILWDNVFGSYNPYDREDRRLIAETSAVFDGYGDLFAGGDWLPLIPTGVSGLDANRWNDPREGALRAIITLRNRTKARVHFRVPEGAPEGTACVALWHDDRELRAGDCVPVEPEGVQAIVIDRPDALRRAVGHLRDLSRRADVALPGYDERRPKPHRIQDDPVKPSRPTAGMVALPGGTLDAKIRHDRRECGCYPFGASDDAMGGWFYKDTLVHALRLPVKPFSMGATAVTNAEFLTFVHATGYEPEDSQAFLKHIARDDDGSLPEALPPEQAALPVTFVSLADARAYAAWRGHRLPTEAEWQWAAEGAGAGNRYPWGNEERSVAGVILAARDPTTATPQGIMGLSGNTWELTESEYTDGHTRFVMLRGGVFLPPGESEWLPARGARPNDSHAKYLLLSDGLDRSEAVSFRTIADHP